MEELQSGPQEPAELSGGDQGAAHEEHGELSDLSGESQGATHEEQGELFQEGQVTAQEEQDKLFHDGQGATQELVHLVRESIEGSPDPLPNDTEKLDINAHMDDEQAVAHDEDKIDDPLDDEKPLDPDEMMEDLQDSIEEQEQEHSMEDVQGELQEPEQVMKDGQGESQEHDEVSNSVQGELKELGDDFDHVQGELPQQDEVLDNSHTRTQQEHERVFEGVPDALDEHEQTPTIPSQEETSLFIAEERIPTPPPTRLAPSRMPPPPPPTTRPTARPPKSTFAKIRNLQQRFKQSKAAASDPYHQYQLMPDDETYLEAAQSLGAGRHASVHAEAETTEDYEREDKKAVAEYQKEKRKYDQIKLRNGKLNFREEIEWIRIRSAEKSRKDKRKRDQQMAKEDDSESDLFPGFHDPRGSREENESDDEDAANFDPSSILGKRRLAMPHKPERQVSMQEAELQSMRVALDAEPDLPRKKRKGSDDSQEPSSAVSSARSRGGRSKGT